MPPTHFFLIDVSHTAVTTGVTTAACASIQRILDDLQGKLPILVLLAHAKADVYIQDRQLDSHVG